jgi:hypothetical protein
MFRVERVAGSRVTCALEHGDMALLGMPVGGRSNHMRREFDLQHVDTGLGGVVRKRGDLSAMAVRQVSPLYLVICTKYTSRTSNLSYALP